jgi:hypothetical protein
LSESATATRPNTASDTRASSSPVFVRLPPSTSVPNHNAQLIRRIHRRRAPKVRLTLLVPLVATITITFTVIATPRQTPLNYLLSIVWSLYAPLAVLGVLGHHYLARQHRPVRGEPRPVATTGIRQRLWSRGRHKASRSSFSGRTNHLLVVTVPTLLAPGNLPALQRVLLTLIVHLPKYFDRFCVDVITGNHAWSLLHLDPEAALDVLATR